MPIRPARKHRYKDETGKTHGKLTVLRFDKKRNGQQYFICRCVCGREVSVRGANLRSGNTTSCGCSRQRSVKYMRRYGYLFVLNKCNPESAPITYEDGTIEPLRADATSPIKKWITICSFCARVGMHTARRIQDPKALLCKCLRRTYNSYHSMKDRCTNENHVQYEDFGGRGITVCENWLDSFRNFVHDMKKRPEGKTIHRIDNDGGYSKENCKWATGEEQGANRRPRSV